MNKVRDARKSRMAKVIEEQGFTLERLPQILSVSADERLFHGDRRVAEPDVDREVDGAHTALSEQVRNPVSIGEESAFGKLHACTLRQVPGRQVERVDRILSVRKQ